MTENKIVCKYIVRECSSIKDDIIGVELKHPPKEFYGKFYRNMLDKARDFCNSPNTCISFITEIDVE